MGTRRKIDQTDSADQPTKKGKKAVATETQPELAVTEETPAAKAAPVKISHKNRSHKYQTIRSKIDRTQKYQPAAAIEQLKKLSYTKFDGTITAHLKLKEEGLSFDVAFPHSTGRTLRVAIADEAILEKIVAGNLDFDVLLSTPQFMPKLTKFAAVLGPKGLMPNPKNGTLTVNVEQKQKELAAGKVTIKTERKAPLIHAGIGKIKDQSTDLVENLETLIKVVKPKLISISLAATMSPGVKVDWEE